MSQKPGTLNQSITNSGLTNGSIVGQGHKVVVTSSNDKNTPTGSGGSDDLSYERKRRMLKFSGINVDESIRNIDSEDLSILGQGQDIQLNGVDFKLINDTQAERTQPKESTE